MRSFLLIILMINLTTGFCQEKTFSIKGKVTSCTEYKEKPSGYIYLYKDSKLIDSINTYRSMPDFWGGWAWTSERFKFKGIKNGKYEIRYYSYFDNQDYPTIEISNSDKIDLNVCFNKLPDRFYSDKTMLDSLPNRDTLFINVYIAAGGEFGGYDEGFWISKIDNQYYGRFYRLPNTYALQRDSSKVIKTYLDNKSKILPLTENIKLNNQAITAINSFLIEINHYHDDWISNAPEHFLIYTKYHKIYRIKNNFEYQPYIKLRDKIKNGL